MPNIDFAVWPTPQRSWNEIRDLARWADDGPWTSIWFADHFMPNTEDGSPKDGPVEECWSIIAALAAVTSRLRIGSLVSPTTFRHPAVLANAAATIDRIAGGRLILGIGAGWQVNEHQAYGVDMLEPADRVDRFEEAIVVIRSLLDNKRTNFAGRHFRITDAPCDPKPIGDPLPILVGTGGPRMTAITARHANEWNTWGTAETAAERIAVLRQACDKVGRDPSTIRCSVQGMFFVAKDDASAERIRAAAPADRAVIGTIERFVDEVGRYAELGYDEVIFPDFTLGPTPEARLDTYGRIGEALVSAFR
ncbi:MAG: LLM class flavin-dependent oxidoreductase [Actinomycetota bacterium]